MLGLGFELPALALRSARPSAAPAPFSPLQLAPSAMFDPGNTALLYQDDAGTTSVTADNQPVGLWQDESPNGLDLSQTTSVERPSYRTDGTFHWIEMDGVDDRMISAPVLRLGNPTTMVIGYQMLSTAGLGRVNIAEISKNSINAMSFGSRPSNDRLQYMSRLDDQGVGNSHVYAQFPYGGYQKRVATLQATSGQVVIRMDGNVVLNTTQNLANEFIDAQPLRVGWGVSGSSMRGAFRLFGLQVWNDPATQPDAAQIDQLESWMANKIGVTL